MNLTSPPFKLHLFKTVHNAMKALAEDVSTRLEQLSMIQLH